MSYVVIPTRHCVWISMEHRLTLRYGVRQWPHGVVDELITYEVPQVRSFSSMRVQP